MQMNYKWDERFIKLARHIATWSKDPSSHIGAVVVSDSRQVLSVGYNGFPRDVKDSDDRMNDRSMKYSYTVHAEMNCIYNASLNGVSLQGSTMYVYGLPVCAECAKGVIQSGIKRVVYYYDKVLSRKWAESSKFMVAIFEESGIECTRMNSM